MRRQRLVAAAAWVLLPLLLGDGCAAPPPPTPLLHPPYFLSRDGNLRYRLPAGWFDATADSQGNGHAVFLVRGDYAGTLTVRELHADAAARKVVNRAGVLDVARLTVALESGSSSGLVVREPEQVKLSGKEACVYEVRRGSGDIVRTYLLDTGERIYAVAALVSSDAPPPARREIQEVQEVFVGAMKSVR
ncbi:MAG: hypothetical protein AB1428_05715 [Bacteroidota bacterium]